MWQKFKEPVLRLRNSLPVKFGIILIIIKFLPDISDYIQTYVFVRDYIFVRDKWMSLIDFLGTGWGTLVTFGAGMCLIAFAVYRASTKQTVSFSDEWSATYERIELDLNNIEDHIIFVFAVKNDTNYGFTLTGDDTGGLRLIAGISKGYFLSPWYVQTTDMKNVIKPHSIGYLRIIRILELGLAFHLAFKKERNERVVLDFSAMKVGIRSNKSKPAYGFILLPGETEIEVPDSPIYWQKYRDLYTKLDK